MSIKSAVITLTLVFVSMHAGTVLLDNMGVNDQLGIDPATCIEEGDLPDDERTTGSGTVTDALGLWQGLADVFEQITTAVSPNLLKCTPVPNEVINYLFATWSLTITLGWAAVIRGIDW